MTARKGLTPLQFWNRCARHDWNYCTSDDQRAWRRGREDRREIDEAAAGDPRLKEIWDAWYEYIGGKRSELPPVPLEDGIAAGTNTKSGGQT